MNVWDILILAAVAGAVILSLVSIRRDRRRGGCCGSCGSCGARCADVGRKTAGKGK